MDSDDDLSPPPSSSPHEPRNPTSKSEHESTKIINSSPLSEEDYNEPDATDSETEGRGRRDMDDDYTEPVSTSHKANTQDSGSAIPSKRKRGHVVMSDEDDEEHDNYRPPPPKKAKARKEIQKPRKTASNGRSTSPKKTLSNQNSQPSRTDDDQEPFIDVEGTETSPKPGPSASPRASSPPASQVDRSPERKASTTPAPDPPPRPKRNKLPAIPKKLKSSLSGPNGSPHPSSNAPTPPPSAPPVIIKPPSAPQRAKASTDFDLRDASVYQSLFGAGKSASAAKSTAPARPNVAVSVHKEREAQRRAELDKMRDEERVRRLKTPIIAADLHDQHYRISRFEDRLKGRKTAMSGPNLLAGAFRHRRKN
ncbi:hypothetical protein SISSUDRAFT_1055262 [Sistotremastrum suecicum HHB10207 ss-3]|uniref:Uncharacterized protein n=1 Tax=Sistotremastrum suecicum HHB10207 ss-3 TaxID=1314776 RepID=A0A165XXF1_9AGAM|nr:hypothetical protein SISSUDRAFT_1055262 [Sistotremastrum suecicum HHB10207 ss-3]